MAFASSAAVLPNNPRGLGGFVTRKWTFTNGSGDTGGVVNTGFAYIHDAQVMVTSHVGAANTKFSLTSPALTIETGPYLTIETGDGIDGTLIVTGRGVK